MNNRWAKIYFNQGILAVSLFEEESKGLIKEMAYRPTSSFGTEESVLLWISFWIENRGILE